MLSFFTILVTAAAAFVAAASTQKLKKCERYTELDLMLSVGTATYSRDFMYYFQEQRMDLLTGLREIFPKARVGIASFNDKTTTCTKEGSLLAASGFKHYCARVDSPLISNDSITEKVVDRLIPAFKDRTFREDVLGGMVVAAMSPEWRAKDKKVARVLMVITDVPYHIPGDVTECAKNLKPFTYLKETEYDCNKHDYPALEEVQATLLANRITPIFVVDNAQKQLYTETAMSLGLGDRVTAFADGEERYMASTLLQTLYEAVCRDDQLPLVGSDETYEEFITKQQSGVSMSGCPCPQQCETNPTQCLRPTSTKSRSLWPSPRPDAAKYQDNETTKKATKSKKSKKTKRTTNKPAHSPVDNGDSEESEESEYTDDEKKASRPPATPVVVASVMGAAAAITAVTSGAYYLVRRNQAGVETIDGEFDAGDGTSGAETRNPHAKPQDVAYV